MDRPWALDALPLVLDAVEWQGLSAGLAQRARLLNLVLSDLYGPQQLLREGLLPAEVVLAHPGFLRPCHGTLLPESLFLHLYAADLARSPDGSWWVLADRAQAPSGAGYALENRIVLSRTLPEAFRESHVERLAPFFRTLRDTLRRLAPGERANPRVALLTPGPYNEAYFEHAYLARYLGFDLVEGADLTVRDRTVFLKTLGGLERVDVLLRRVDDVFCDPLSLQSDSTLGVAGLVHAVRAGNVVVANALGSGLVESPALMAFLPLLCRTLLGEELLLPSVATWWCGHADALEYVLANLESLVVKPSFPGRGMEPAFGERLSAEEREALSLRLRERPHEYVAQEQVALSTAPVWDGERAQPRHLVVRTYAAASEDGHHVLPGGLTRIAVSRDSLVVSMQRGGGSKDTWVRCDGPVAAVTLLRESGAPLALTRGSAALPSRVADNLFWLGRYVERAEGTARLARGILARLSDETSTGCEIEPLLHALALQVGSEAAVPEASADASALERELSRRLFSGDAPRGLRATVATFHQLASVLRDQLSLDTWRVLNRLDQEVTASAAGGAVEPAAARDLLDRLIVGLAAMSGLVAESMTRGQGWRFADMGRRIERASHAGSLLGSTLVRPQPDEEPLLEALLEIADSAITHRRRYFGALQPAPVIDLLLTDESNPRGISYQVVALAAHVAELPRATAGAARSTEERVALAALTRVRLAEPSSLAHAPEGGKRLQLEELLSRLGDELAALSDALTRSFLTHAEAARRLDRL
jgi:uncharacterized circularly permuted ATP-grasp superfamily protein/uncharacterized alpha-E superfamily protein